MGFFSSIVSTLSSVVSTAASIASSIGGAISSAVSTIAPVISKVPNQIGMVVNIISTLAQVLNVIRPNENIDSIGDRVIQASEQDPTMKPERFNTYEEYLNAIRTFELDPQKTKQNMENGTATVIGLATVGKATEERFDLRENSSAEMIQVIAKSPEFFNPDRMGNLVRNDANFGEISRYLDGKLSLGQTDALYDRLFAMEQKINPSANRDQFDNALYAAKNNQETA